MRLLANITDVDPNLPITGAADKLSYGLQMMLIGMVTVFAVLIIIWLALIGFRYLFANIGKTTSQKNDVADSIPETSTYTPAPMQDAVLIAVIAAAIAAAESESNGAKFRVVSFRRK